MQKLSNLAKVIKSCSRQEWPKYVEAPLHDTKLLFASKKYSMFVLNPKIRNKMNTEFLGVTFWRLLVFVDERRAASESLGEPSGDISGPSEI